MNPFRTLHRPLLCAALLGFTLPGHASVEADMAFALDSIWRMERPSVSLASESFISKASKTGTTYQAKVNNSPVYLMTGEESASVEFGRKRFPATESPWGALPRLDMEHARLLELSTPKKRYFAFVGQGKGLFSVGDWQRYSFIHVVDVTARHAPVYYPLFSDAYLGERVLGRLPGSPVLNFARLVPSSWSSRSEPSAYEVSLYALNPKGPERVIEEGRPLAYSLQRQGGSWKIERIRKTPVTDAQDQNKRSFTAPNLTAVSAR